MKPHHEILISSVFSLPPRVNIVTNITLPPDRNEWKISIFYLRSSVFITIKIIHFQPLNINYKYFQTVHLALEEDLIVKPKYLDRYLDIKS